jgi:hypothetical protein
MARACQQRSQHFLLWAKEAIVVMDGDENGRKPHLQPSSYTDLARAQTTRLKAAGVELQVLEGYGIENYFPRQTVEKVLQGTSQRSSRIQARQAHELLERGGVVGKIVLMDGQ